MSKRREQVRILEHSLAILEEQYKKATNLNERINLIKQVRNKQDVLVAMILRRRGRRRRRRRSRLRRRI